MKNPTNLGRGGNIKPNDPGHSGHGKYQTVTVHQQLPPVQKHEIFPGQIKPSRRPGTK